MYYYRDPIACTKPNYAELLYVSTGKCNQICCMYKNNIGTHVN